jgi:hypothetical protein
MHNLHPRIAAADSLQFRREPRLIAGEEKFRDLRQLAQSERSAFDQLGWAFVMAHRVERNLHARNSKAGRGLIKRKKKAAARAGWQGG